MQSEPDDSEKGGQTLLNGDSAPDFDIPASPAGKAGDSTLGPGPVPDTVFNGNDSPAPSSHGANDKFDQTLQLPAGNISNDLTLPPPDSGTATMAGGTHRSESLEKNAPGMPVVPGFILLGELGRGGMGVVYKARQKGLNRMVALKMVLSGVHASPEQLSRFNTEAEAVAKVLHPNIIQIFEVGEHEGLPFFALEFLDGGDLQKKFAGKPQPAREAAQTLRLLASGMGAAHDCGVIHRDLKPANILLNKSGLPKITDFGLAKQFDSDNSQTKSGALMGTPNYMAPEQARGDTHAIGPSADIYALGVILYEALTGRVPFVGNSVIEILKQIEDHDPIPPTRLQPDIPPDLETICLKCLQKDPARRYKSAHELADDLDYYLNGWPIKARPTTRIERAYRWCRRNPGVASLTGAVALLLIAVAATSSAMAWRISVEKAQTQQAKELADKHAEEAEAATKVAVQNAEIAGQQTTLALQTLQILVEKVQKQLADAPGQQTLRKDLLNTAMEGLKKLAQGTKSSITDASVAAAHLQMGHIHKTLGDSESAFREYLASHTIVEKRQQDQPNRDAAKRNLATTFTFLGDMSQELRRDVRAALDYYKKALEIRKEIVERPNPGEGEVKKEVAVPEVADAELKCAVTWLRLGNPSQALGHFEEALRIRKELVAANPTSGGAKRNLGFALNGAAEMAFLSGDTPRALDYYKQCIDIREDLHKKNPKVLGVTDDLARALANFAELLARTGQVDQARKLYLRAIGLAEELKKADPNNVNYQLALAANQYRLGALERSVGDQKSSTEWFQKALAIQEPLASKDPSNEIRQLEWMRALAAAGKREQADTLATALVARSGNDPEVRFETARIWALCSVGLDPNKAAPYLAKSLGSLQEAVRHGYQDPVTTGLELDLAPLKSQPDFNTLIRKMGEQTSSPARPSGQSGNR